MRTANRLAVVALAAAMLLVAACDTLRTDTTSDATSNPSDVTGGPCRYRDTPGVATIVLVETADPNAGNCTSDPVLVAFEFVPDDPAAENLATQSVLTITGGYNPPQSWVRAEGLTVGSEHACVRRDITSGTCSPILFEFPDVDMAAGIEACHANH